MIESARKQSLFNQKAAFLFIDEIHRFNKSQQDSLLGRSKAGYSDAYRRHDREPVI